MKYLLILFLIAPILVNAQVIKEEDEFTGVVKWSLESPKVIQVEEGGIVRAMYNAVYSDEHWALAFFALSGTESIANNETVYFLVDGERYSFPVASKDIEYQSGQLVSYVIILPTKEEFIKIGQAEKVRVKIGSHVFSLSEIVRADMNEISRLVSAENK